jgi:DNA-binding NtrC family response regulator
MLTTVLVIDEDPDIRDLLFMLLHEEGGYTVIEAADPASALDILHAAPYRLIVLFDDGMPRMDGEALLTVAEQEAQLIKRHAFVCMTGAHRASLSPTLIALLARYKVPLISKPFDIDDLLAVIRQAERRLVQRPAFKRLTLKLEQLLRPQSATH